MYYFFSWNTSTKLNETMLSNLDFNNNGKKSLKVIQKTLKSFAKLNVDYSKTIIEASKTIYEQGLNANGFNNLKI